MLTVHLRIFEVKSQVDFTFCHGLTHPCLASDQSEQSYDFTTNSTRAFELWGCGSIFQFDKVSVVVFSKQCHIIISLVEIWIPLYSVEEKEPEGEGRQYSKIFDYLITRRQLKRLFRRQDYFDTFH